MLDTHPASIGSAITTSPTALPVRTRRGAEPVGGILQYGDLDQGEPAPSARSNQRCDLGHCRSESSSLSSSPPASAISSRSSSRRQRIRCGSPSSAWRATLSGDALTNVEVIFDTTPKGTSVHYGGRLAFMRDGTLLVTTGEGAEYREDAQRLDSLLGKAVGITDDGVTPRDNPFVQQTGAQGAIWSFGHRNPQGLYVDPQTDTVFLAEHGRRGGDELNVIEPVANYGWPIATHGIDYTGGRISPFETYAGMREPLVYWRPSIGRAGFSSTAANSFPSGTAIYSSRCSDLDICAGSIWRTDGSWHSRRCWRIAMRDSASWSWDRTARYMQSSKRSGTARNLQGKS
jgi:hypothetical protein